MKQEAPQPEKRATSNYKSSASAMNMKLEAREDQRFQAVKVKSGKFSGIKKKAVNADNKTAQKSKTQDQGFQVTDFESYSTNGSEKKAKHIKRKKTKKQERAQSKTAHQQEMQEKAPFYRESLQMGTSASISHSHEKIKPAPFYMNGKDGEESPDISEEELTDTGNGKTDESVRESELYEKRKLELVGKPLSITSSTKTKAVYVAVAPGTTLYFQVQYID